MSKYVLIHGAGFGAWCWYKMLPLLQRAGHEVIAPDLPGLGRDVTPLDRISLAFWTDHVCQIVLAQPEPVVLVGHSRAGIILSCVAEKCPEKIAMLVYVTAILARDGETARQLLMDDGTTLLLPNQVLADGGKSWSLKEEALREVYCEESPEEDVALAKLLVRPEPRGPGGTPIHITEANFGSVPRMYIECLRDKAVPPLLQKHMYSALPCRKVMTIDTDHSPFFSAPERLADCLLSIGPGRSNAA